MVIFHDDIFMVCANDSRPVVTNSLVMKENGKKFVMLGNKIVHNVFDVFLKSTAYLVKV